jgi:hypothetical protein
MSFGRAGSDEKALEHRFGSFSPVATLVSHLPNAHPTQKEIESGAISVAFRSDEVHVVLQNA